MFGESVPGHGYWYCRARRYRARKCLSVKASWGSAPASDLARMNPLSRQSYWRSTLRHLRMKTPSEPYETIWYEWNKRWYRWYARKKGGQRRPKQSDTIWNGDSRMPQLKRTWSEDLLWSKWWWLGKGGLATHSKWLDFYISTAQLFTFFRLSPDAAPANCSCCWFIPPRVVDISLNIHPVTSIFERALRIINGRTSGQKTPKKQCIKFHKIQCKLEFLIPSHNRNRNSGDLIPGLSMISDDSGVHMTPDVPLYG